MDVLSLPKLLREGPIFIGLPSLINNTTKTSADEDLVKMRPAIAEQSRQKIKKKKKKRKTQNSS